MTTGGSSTCRATMIFLKKIDLSRLKKNKAVDGASQDSVKEAFLSSIIY